MSRGHDRERDVRRELEAQGFWVGRICGSLGDVDLVALRRTVPDAVRLGVLREGATVASLGRPLKLPVLASSMRLVVEVKSTAGGPYERFGPADRRELLDAAEFAGCDAVLAYCPPGRPPWSWIWPDEWPT